ncbi:protein PBDC1 isoform X3 [Chamaea fasciata]|uniref:protein PBDC1 isoform X3 n=1 Tax=Chamaea fasciata TaxID=190680 RepID=UPI003369F9E7
MAAAGLAGLGPGEAAAAAQALALPAESFGNDLTKADDRIYEEFRQTFRELRVDVLDPEELKSEPAKAKWRPFCLAFEGLVEDFNFGTLLRLDSRREYSEENTIFATRIQFFAIEIARNREGCNDHVYGRARETAAQEGKSG